MLRARQRQWQSRREHANQQCTDLTPKGCHVRLDRAARGPVVVQTSYSAWEGTRPSVLSLQLLRLRARRAPYILNDGM